MTGQLAAVGAKNLKPDSKHIALPALAARIASGEDGTIHREDAGKRLRMDLQPSAESVAIDFSAVSCRVPFWSSPQFRDLQAKGGANPGELAVSGFSGYTATMACCAAALGCNGGFVVRPD